MVDHTSQRPAIPVGPARRERLILDEATVVARARGACQMVCVSDGSLAKEIHCEHGR